MGGALGPRGPWLSPSWGGGLRALRFGLSSEGLACDGAFGLGLGALGLGALGPRGLAWSGTLGAGALCSEGLGRAWEASLARGGGWPGGPWPAGVLGQGGPLARRALGSGGSRGALARALWFAGPGPWSGGPWLGGPLARWALGPGGPWPGGPLARGALGPAEGQKPPKITKLSSQPAWTPRQPPGPGIQLPGTRGPPGGGGPANPEPKTLN